MSYCLIYICIHIYIHTNTFGGPLESCSLLGVTGAKNSLDAQRTKRTRRPLDERPGGGVFSHEQKCFISDKNGISSW